MTRWTCILVATAVTTCAFGSTSSPDPSTMTVTVAKQTSVIPMVPKFGIRFGGGNWNEFMVDAGVDLTFNVPLLPIPQLRVDGEVWGKPGNFGADRRGNAISLLGVQTFLLGYAGVGPCYYFTDDQGNHRSGIGAKILGGLNLPDNAYVEAGIIIGPSNPPVFFTIGKRF